MKGEIKIVKTRVDNLEVGDIYRYQLRRPAPTWSRWFEIESIAVLRQAGGVPSNRMTIKSVGGDVQTQDKLDVVEVQLDVHPKTIAGIVAEAHAQ